MKWLVSLVLALVMVTPAFAGEDPYIAIVGPDKDGANKWYFSAKHQQFLLDEVGFLGSDAMSFPSGTKPEKFVAQTEINQPEICDNYGKFGRSEGCDKTFCDKGNVNAVTRAGNSGSYEWYVRLPKKPSGEINLVLQCGVLKANAFAPYHYDAIELCAAETGERYSGLCARDEVDPGVNPLIVKALPKITAIAMPGKYNINFKQFNLTAFRNPGTYSPISGGVLVNGEAGQILNGTDDGTKILLKACMDKTVVTKLPVTGQINAAGDQETDLEYGDLIYVKLDVPRANTVDIYCHSQSLRVAGIGETWY